MKYFRDDNYNTAMAYNSNPPIPRMPTLQEMREWFTATFINPLLPPGEFQIYGEEKMRMVDFRIELHEKLATASIAAILAADEVIASHEAVTNHVHQIFRKEMEEKNAVLAKVSTDLVEAKKECRNMEEDLKTALRRADDLQRQLSDKRKLSRYWRKKTKNANRGHK